MERGQFSCQFREHIVDRILSLGFVAVAQLDLEAADKIGTTIGVIALEALLYIADLASQFGHPTAHPPIGGEHNPARSCKSAQRRSDSVPEIGRATSELQALMRISYAVFCLKKK